MKAIRASGEDLQKQVQLGRRMNRDRGIDQADDHTCALLPTGGGRVAPTKLPATAPGMPVACGRFAVIKPRSSKGFLPKRRFYRGVPGGQHKSFRRRRWPPTIACFPGPGHAALPLAIAALLMPARPSLLADGANVLRGLCMGGADVVPGVSGGTVALVLGIYRRLVEAISHFDARLIGLLRQRNWRQAAAHVDLRFLLGLGTGIAIGFLIMTAFMNRLLTQADTRAYTLAAFFGMILASSLLVGRMVRPDGIAAALCCLLLGLGGALFALWLSRLPGQNVEPSYPYLFLCGSVAICAMILPGISGAMILLILGVYVHLTEVPRMLLQGEQWGHCLLTVLVFGLGCAISLVAFSKVLRWLLIRHQSATMALLCGFMVGALAKIWPFQRDLTPEGAKFKYKLFEPMLPDWSTPATWTVVGVVAVAFLVVISADWLARLSSRQHPKSDDPSRI